MDITFSKEDARWVHHLHNDGLVVAIRIGSINVHQVLVDNGSSINILYYETQKKLCLTKSDIKLENVYIYDFGGEAIKETIHLPITLREGTYSATQVMDLRS